MRRGMAGTRVIQKAMIAMMRPIAETVVIVMLINVILDFHYYHSMPAFSIIACLLEAVTNSRRTQTEVGET